MGTTYIGAWRAGTDGHYLWQGAGWDGVEVKWKELSGKGLRLGGIDTYRSGNPRQWVGAWRAGTDGHYLWAGVSWKDFTAKWKELAAQGLRLVDVATYVENNQRLFAGV